jgi:signal transduction histidine kinase
LEVSRLEGNRIPIVISEIELGPIIEKSIEEIKSQAAQKNLELNYLRENLPRVKADPERLKQVIINLLSNAVKYSIKGKVEVTTKLFGKKVLLTVADTGVGISAEDQKKLFQKFSRVYNEETKMVGGTGLGLWISRELVQKMGGDIEVESIRGVGSHFTVNLPSA